MYYDEKPIMVNKDAVTIGPDNFVKVAGYPLGYIEDGCLIVRDGNQRRGIKRGGERIAIPLHLLAQLGQAIENQTD